MKFETPVVEIKKFDVEDILTTSGEAVAPEEPPCPENTALPCVGD